MGAQYWTTPAIFLIDTLFSLYIFAVLLRVLLQWCGADHRNPLSQFLIRVTHPVLRPLRRVVPSIGPVDTAAVLLMLALQMSSVYLVALIQGATPSLAAASLWALAQLLELVLNLFFYAVLIRTLLSWLGPLNSHAGIALLHSLTEPLLRVGRRWLPVAGGIDLSPLLPLIGLQLVKMLLLPPLRELALWLN